MAGQVGAGVAGRGEASGAEVEDRPRFWPKMEWRWVGLWVLGVVVLAAGAKVVRRSAGNWALDRDAAHAHREQALAYRQMEAGVEAGRAAGSREVWAAVGLNSPDRGDQARYFRALAEYHRRQAERHEWAIGKPWAVLLPEAPPGPPGPTRPPTIDPDGR